MTDLDTPTHDPARWRNRIVRYEAAVDPEQLLANPRNWRIHPKRQSEAMVAALGELGWVDAVIVNVNTDTVIDGHLRCAEAIAAHEVVPVLYVDLDAEEELKALATFDVITGLAVTEHDALKSIRAEVTFVADVLGSVVDEALGITVDDGLGEPDAPAPAPEPALVFGMVSWKRNRKVECSESEVTALDSLHEVYKRNNDGSSVGFVRWLVDAAGGPA